MNGDRLAGCKEAELPQKNGSDTLVLRRCGNTRQPSTVDYVKAFVGWQIAMTVTKPKVVFEGVKS